jgi:ornithine carbamoyltransferase
LGDASCNVARSWIYAAEIFDFKIVCAAPDTYQTKITNSHTEVTTDPLAACRNADLLYTDTWISMGKEDEKAERLPVFENYQINEKLLEVAKSNALVLHCLPAYRDKEISGTLFEARAKDIFDQAENRLHVQKGIMHWLVAKN